MVAPFGRKAHGVAFVTLDSLSSQTIPGVPSALLLTADGRIEHSAVGLKRVVSVLDLSGRQSPARLLLKQYQDSVKARR